MSDGYAGIVIVAQAAIRRFLESGILFQEKASGMSTSEEGVPPQFNATASNGTNLPLVTKFGYVAYA